MSNTYNNGGRYSHEKNDCSVIALAYAWNMPYQKAHEICKKAGRVDGRGMNLFFDVFGVTRYKKYRQFKNRGVSYHGRPGMSVQKFRDTHRTGTYIIHISGHVFTMIDGKIYNQSSKTQHVEEYVYVTADFGAPKPETFIKILRMAKCSCENGARLLFTVERNKQEYTVELDTIKYPGLYDNPVAASAVLNRIPDIQNMLDPILPEEQEESFVQLLTKVLSEPINPEKLTEVPDHVLDVCVDDGYVLAGEDPIEIVNNKVVFSTIQFQDQSWVKAYRGEYGLPQFIAFYNKLTHKEDRRPANKVYRIRKRKLINQ